MTQYTMKAFEPEAAEPALQMLALAHDHDALDAGRGLLRRNGAVQQVEVWRDGRRVATVERVI